MKMPKIKSSKVTIFYSADDGYQAEDSYASKKSGVQHMALLEALEELSRLTALFGFEDAALEKFNGARQRVAKWKEENLK